MPRKSQATYQTAGGLYDDMATGSIEGLRSEGDRTRAMLQPVMGSLRPDVGGAPINMMQLPITYQQRVERMWEFYALDPLFRRLIDRVADFVANGSHWEIRSPDDREAGGAFSWIKKIKDFWTSKEAKIDREEEVWNSWSEVLNAAAPNTVQGLDTVVRWAAKHCLLQGMWIPHWRYGTHRYGKQEFRFPMELTCYPGSAITLNRKSASFMEEEVLLTMPQTSQIMEGYPAQAPMHTMGPTGQQRPLPGMGSGPAGPSESFVLKYLWSPGDLSHVRIGQYSHMGWGAYPSPPFYSLFPQFVIRQKLFAADAAILDGITNYIELYKIGTKDFPPKPPKRGPGGTIVEKGTVATIRDAIEGGGRGPAKRLYVPGFVDVDFLMPDPAILLSEDKYLASTLEMYQAFGILISRSSGGRNEKFERANTANFEEMLRTIQLHIRSFLMRMAARVTAMNTGKLTAVPMWVPNPVNTKSEAYTKMLLELTNLGRLSAQTLLRFHGLDNTAEARRIARELATDLDDMHDANVPLRYVQRADPPPDPNDSPGPDDAPDGPGTIPAKEDRPTGAETGITPTVQPKGTMVKRSARASRGKRAKRT